MTSLIPTGMRLTVRPIPQDEQIALSVKTADGYTAGRIVEIGEYLEAQPGLEFQRGDLVVYPTATALRFTFGDQPAWLIAISDIHARYAGSVRE